MSDRSRAYKRLLLAGLLIVLAGLALGKQTWASVVLAPQRQTVPLTPPPTWTPVVTVVIEPTKPRPPTRTAEQTPVSEEPDPWLGLSVSPQIVAPNMEAVLHISLVNQGGRTLTAGQVSLQLPEALVYVGGEASNGAIGHDAGMVRWTVQVAAQSESALEIRVRVAEAALPEQRLEVQADLAWPGGTVSSNSGVLALPLALLP